MGGNEERGVLGGIERLIEELLLASQLYYQGEGSDLTDEEYDDKLSFLRKHADEDESLLADKRVNDLLEGSVAGGSAPSEEDAVVQHTVPMLSLEKANTEDEVKSFYEKSIKNGATGHKLQAKLDGFAVSIHYKDGKQSLMATRGDGEVGADISHLIGHSELTMKGAPLTLNTHKNCELRGEFFLTHSQYDKLNQTRLELDEKELKNSRNGVVGLLTKSKGGLGYKAEVTFVVYSILIDDKYTDLSVLSASEPNIITIDDLTVNELKAAGETGEVISKKDFTKLMDLVNRFGAKRIAFDIPTDGVVIKPLNEAEMFNKMGSTSHHPNAFIAFKYPSAKAETKVLKIVESIGKTGKVSLVAQIVPTDLEGTVISNVTCHNYAWLYEMGIREGSTVMVTRANDVIPAITTVIDKGTGPAPSIPTVCPSCGGPLIGDGNEIPRTLLCNNDDCPSRIYFQMRDVTGKRGFDIDGLNNVGLLALCETGKVVDAGDLFGLTVDDLKDLVMGETNKGNPRKFGENRAEKIIDLIETARTNTPAFKIVNILGFHGLGTSISKQLLEEFGSIENILYASKEQLEKLDRFGETRVEIILNRQEYANKIFDKLLEQDVTLDNGLNEVKAAKNGQSFAISGKVPDDFANRTAFVDYMEALGWEFDKAPKKTTTVVFGDSTDTSSKIKKANKLGLTIVAPDDYKTV